MRLNDSKSCGKCKACTRFNGQNGSGYQPCHNIKKTGESKPPPRKP